jgi:hypothetical protein
VHGDEVTSSTHIWNRTSILHIVDVCRHETGLKNSKVTFYDIYLLYLATLRFLKINKMYISFQSITTFITQGDSLVIGETHSSVLGCERRPFSTSITSRSCFASFPVCVYKFSSHYLNNNFYRQ